MLQNLAHVKWFNTEQPVHQEGFNAAELFAVVVIVVAGLLIFRFIDAWLREQKITAKLDKALKSYRPIVPLLVRLSTAGLLVINYAQDLLLAPNVASTDSTTSGVIGAVFLLAALLLALGLFTRAGVAVLLGGYLLVLTEADFVDVLDHFEYIAIAGYLWLRGPGKYSLDNYRKKGKLAMPDLRKYSLDFYRIGVGIGLSVLALSEKIFNVSAATDFLNQHDWNMLSSVGVSDKYFILIAGSVELLVGLALIFNYASRLIVSTVLALMAITAILLGIEEIYGHLFAIGIVVAVWVNDTKPAKNT